MNTHTFKIIAPLNTNEASVLMDGKPLEGVTRVSLELSANDLTRLSLDIIGYVEVEGEFREDAILSVRQGTSHKGDDK